MSPGLVLNNEDCPITPDPRKKKYYRSFIAKLQFPASWIRFDTSFTVSTLACFCVSAGPSHWTALHHLMEYLEGFPSLKLTYRRRTGVDDGLSGFADSDWGNSSIVAERPETFVCTTGLRFFGTQRCKRPRRYPRPKRSTTWRRQRRRRFCTVTFVTSGNNVISGRERTKHIDIRKRFANEVIQNGHMKLIRVATSQQLADILTKSLHFPQWQACVAGILGKKIVTTTKGTFVLKRGCRRQCYQVESRRPLRGVFHRLEEPRPELDIDLNPGESDSESRERASVPR
jgi:hypothetical protein